MATRPPSSPSGSFSGFMQLPIETRQQIYHYALVRDFEKRIVDISVEPRGIGRYKLNGLEGIESLVFVNRTVHHEVMRYCFNRFNFHLRNDAASLRFVVREFYRQIGTTARKLVTYITIPDVSVDAVFFHATNMVALFASAEVRYCELVTETKAALLLLRRFPALVQVDLGLDILESQCIRMPPWEALSWKSIDETDTMYSLNVNSRVHPTIDMRLYDDLESPIFTALCELKHLRAGVKAGIWWKSTHVVLPDLIARQLQVDLLQKLQKVVAPLRVECKGQVA